MAGGIARKSAHLLPRAPRRGPGDVGDVVRHAHALPVPREADAAHALVVGVVALPWPSARGEKDEKRVLYIGGRARELARARALEELVVVGVARLDLDVDDALVRRVEHEVGRVGDDALVRDDDVVKGGRVARPSHSERGEHDRVLALEQRVEGDAVRGGDLDGGRGALLALGVSSSTRARLVV